jgi:hypothetical protein
MRVLSSLRARLTLLDPVPPRVTSAGTHETLLARRSEPQPGPGNALLGQELIPGRIT